MAQVAHVLARGVREGGVNPIDALRILKHELRRLNTNSWAKVEGRSRGAQASIDKYAPNRPPANGSDDSLHADHVYPLTVDRLHEVTTVEAWTHERERLATVVYVTAKENYALQQIERQGTHGPEKYAKAGVTFATWVPW
jgi:hypothetical protein